MNVLEIMKEGLTAEAIAALNKPLDKKDIKQRDGGFGKKLNYIEGSTVIDILNQAFGYKWSFEVVSKQIIPSVDKVTKKDGKEIVTPQAPYVEVLGRLTVPGVGVKEQFGTKILLGGASEQEGASKSAATDALKKCATLMGIGLELYDDAGGDTGSTSNTGGGYNKGSYGNNNYNNNSQGSGTYRTYTKPEPAPAPKAPAAPDWSAKQDDIKKLKELKAILGVGTNEQLNAFVKEFTGNGSATYADVTPANISSFNKFLEKKAENA